MVESKTPTAMSNNKCETIVFSDKAYNAIIRESFAKHPVETGGILLGYILDNGLWIVMEVIPPGINGVFQTAYFEYDQEFVNYLGTSVANQYREPLQVLGLWHRHPGSMDYFSSTDDGTNSEFASQNPYGVISGLVNIDPKFRLTMYHLDHISGPRPRNVAYSTVDFEVGDDLIPEKFFALRYIDESRSELNPTPTAVNTQAARTRTIPCAPRNQATEEMSEEMPSTPPSPTPPPSQPSVIDMASARLGKWFKPAFYGIVGLVIFIIGLISGANLFPHKEYITVPAEHENIHNIFQQAKELLRKNPTAMNTLFIPESDEKEYYGYSEPAIIIAALLASQSIDPALQQENPDEENGNATPNDDNSTDGSNSSSQTGSSESSAAKSPDNKVVPKDSLPTPH